MITARIDVTKIEKDRLYKSEKTGSIYLDVILIETPKSEFSDYMIAQSVSADERKAGTRGAILGNASNLVPNGSAKIADGEVDFG